MTHLLALEDREAEEVWVEARVEERVAVVCHHKQPVRKDLETHTQDKGLLVELHSRCCGVTVQPIPPGCSVSTSILSGKTQSMKTNTEDWL